MGEVIRLDERRQARRMRDEADATRAHARVEFLFDLASPFTYLAAERVDRAFASVTWTPASERMLRGGAPWAAEELDALCVAAAEAGDARKLRVTWPERWPADVPEAMRVAHYAAERGRGALFVQSAARLAFGGGYDLRDPLWIAEAGTAAGLGADECEQAAREERRDAAIERAARRLLAVRATCLPVLRVDGDVFAGEGRVAEAIASARARVAFA